MVKSTILSIAREEKRVEIKFKKDKEFINLYLDLLSLLGIDFSYHNFSSDGSKEEAKSELLSKEDELFCHKGKFMFEVFFGHKKVLMILESDKKLQQKFIDNVYSKVKWIKVSPDKYNSKKK